MSASYWIEKLGLLPHPEGGFFKEVYRSGECYEAERLPRRFEAARAFSTAIFYLLQADDFSAFHRIKSDEIWHHYEGGTLEIIIIDPTGELQICHLGKADATACPMLIVPHGCWFAAIPSCGSEYVLAGCTVAPGFDFADFELAKRSDLLRQAPQHAKWIERLTRADSPDKRRLASLSQKAQNG